MKEENLIDKKDENKDENKDKTENEINTENNDKRPTMKTIDEKIVKEVDGDTDISKIEIKKDISVLI